ncbi:hypothetical protein M406DRAFT_330055 [Cryphonectria parasitica EP155]|uniref:Uncharacterized protein n=1 Tax=Cryphonectria parasitica (strain ATCC 38755 / EP155) TaxID=660469 RepID=A0A9P4Y3E1_CRYP1|nr:uncharacterized protein M406DRAFT_330055 [Cryphonectria parasitica EP155]KAF3766222.1 hypothetical protein M406DRAFT_330055 [Cryphonectria parasitica EP155]
MAWDACVDLGTIKVSSDPDAKFMLAVRTSASLSLPDDQEDISAAELRHLVRSGSIWVTRGAPCEFQLSIGFASPLDGGLQEDLEHVIIRALESLSNAVEDKIQVEEMARSEATRITTLPPHTQQFRDFRRNPPRKARGATRDQRDIPIYDLGSNLQKDKLGSLTHAALSLLLGSRKRFDGIRCIRPRDCVTLLDIAPAVWSAHYFQEIAARVQLAPLISSALGNMLNSKSTRLRQIVQTLASDPIAELRKKTLLLILRSTPARIPNTHQPERIQSNDLPRGSFEVAILDSQACEGSILLRTEPTSAVETHGGVNATRARSKPISSSRPKLKVADRPEWAFTLKDGRDDNRKSSLARA